ncbi:MAG TPA: hypothetical protein DCS07_03435 [Bdellovibrionales bacterium]|nr:hypothetical protein [Bdellovibrionales bacterium]
MIGRVGHGVNVAAEKVTLSQLNKAAARLNQENSLGLRHFFVLPGQSASSKPCYEWILLADRPGALDPEIIQEFLDQALMELNSDYRENRLDFGFLDVPTIQVLSSELASQYFEKASHRGQLKMKVAFDSREKFQAFLNDLELDATVLNQGWAVAEAV